jgi:hypothetical protein
MELHAFFAWHRNRMAASSSVSTTDGGDEVDLDVMIDRVVRERLPGDLMGPGPSRKSRGWCVGKRRKSLPLADRDGSDDDNDDDMTDPYVVTCGTLLRTLLCRPTHCYRLDCADWEWIPIRDEVRAWELYHATADYSAVVAECEERTRTRTDACRRRWSAALGGLVHAPETQQAYVLSSRLSGDLRRLADLAERLQLHRDLLHQTATLLREQLAPPYGRPPAISPATLALAQFAVRARPGGIANEEWERALAAHTNLRPLERVYYRTFVREMARTRGPRTPPHAAPVVK